jgi:hypothetical protein
LTEKGLPLSSYGGQLGYVSMNKATTCSLLQTPDTKEGIHSKPVTFMLAWLRNARNCHNLCSCAPTLEGAQLIQVHAVMHLVETTLVHTTTVVSKQSKHLPPKDFCSDADVGRQGTMAPMPNIPDVVL